MMEKLVCIAFVVIRSLFSDGKPTCQKTIDNNVRSFPPKTQCYLPLQEVKYTDSNKNKHRPCKVLGKTIPFLVGIPL